MNIYLAYYGSTLLQIILSIKLYDYLYCCHYYLVIFVFFHILLHNRDGILPSPFCQSDLHSVLLSHHFSAPKLAILLLSGLWSVQLVRILAILLLKLSDFSFYGFQTDFSGWTFYLLMNLGLFLYLAICGRPSNL